MTKFRKKIIGVVSLFILAVIATNTLEVKAADKKLCEDNATVVKKYQAKLTKNKDDSLYTISMEKTSAKYKNIEFKITKINNTAITNGAIVKSGSLNKKLDLDQYFEYNSDNEYEVKITLEAAKDADCNAGVKLELGITKGGSDFDTQGAGPAVTDGVIVGDNPIDCSKPQTGEFEQNFCLAKNNAPTANRLDLGSKKTIDENNINELKCSYQNREAADGYPNKAYYYASNEVLISSDEKYEYHFSPSVDPETSGTISCKLKCEEAVVVEYGPPVATKAGLCFEYKVKVTSRVNCTLAEKPEKPKTYSGYCSPTPWCTSSHGKSYKVNQGGPNDDFDSCINECDGGKYTTKCSNKCYKKVYGKELKQTNSMSLDVNYAEKLALGDDNVANNLSTCVAASEHGCYYRSSDGTIHFRKKSLPFAYGGSIARWYYDYNRITSNLTSNYTPDEEGIPRHNYGNNTYCDDNCWWEGCSGKYLNPGAAEADNATNIDIYNKIVAKCSAQAICTNTTAEFTIAINYKKNGDEDSTKVTTIEYPYVSTSPSNTTGDKLTSLGATSGVQNTTSQANSTVLSYSGCYAERDAKRWYMTEWSFPGTWINNKTGEISFVPKTDKGWHEVKDKFCMPLDAKNANSNYYRWVNGDTSITTTQVENQLNSQSGTKFKDRTTANGYNILATARKFGYFSWNFDIKCFYSLYDKPVCSSGTPDCCTGSDCPKVRADNYTIRSVENTDLFPGATTTDGTKARVREIGWNWTSAAKNTKNSNYVVDPEKLANDIQTAGDKIYDDPSNIEYEFILTPEAISEIRSYNNANDSYTYWGGSTANSTKKNPTQTGINYYRSNLFRSEGTGMVLNSSNVKKLGTPGKNNERG